MNEPAVTPAEWLALVVTSGIAGMGGAMAWFSKHRSEMEKRMSDIDGPKGRMACYEEMHAEVDKKVAVVETCQENTAATLLELKALHRDMNLKLDRLLEK